MESSERICSDGDQSATSNGTATAKRSSRRVFATASFLLPRSSETFADLSATDTPSAIAELRTWLAQAFPASPSPSRESNSAPTTSETCGPQLGTAFAWFDRDTSCWKTSQASLLADTQPWSSLTWPRSGMWDGGVCWELPMLARRTSEIGGGFAARWPTPTAADHLANESERIEEWERRKEQKRTKGVNLQFALRHAVQKWPTPTAHMHKEQGSPAEFTRNTPTLTSAAHGGIPTQPASLNPEWVEWLMGWPIGWTDLRPLGTDKFQQWLRAHGGYSHD